ncbi:MAG: DUF6868 family protein [Gammaproteobacteria bacterium]
METLIDIRAILGWCSLINIILLLVWWVIYVTGRGWIHSVSSIWFKLSAQQFDAIHYGGIAFYKIIVYVFNIIPWVALHIVTSTSAG